MCYTEDVPGQRAYREARTLWQEMGAMPTGPWPTWSELSDAERSRWAEIEALQEDE